LLDAVIDIFFLLFLLLHMGQGGFSFALMETRASNPFPHFWHSYS
jgi:hypothetical protein